MRLLIVVFLMLIPSMLFGAIETDNGTAKILEKFIAATGQWTSAIKPAGMYLFSSFVLIDMVFTFSFLMLKGAEFAELTAELIRKIMWIGFFMFLFQSVDLLKIIPASFAQLAFNASHADIEPDTIIESAMTLVSALWGAMTLTDIVGSLLDIFTGLICLGAFSAMATQLFMIMVKIQAIIAGSYLMFGFGGLSYTRDMAINPLKAIFAAGMELMFIKLFLALTIDTVISMEQNIGKDIDSSIAIIVMSIILFSAVQMIPGIVTSLMSGSLGGNSTSGLAFAAAAVGGAAAGVAAVSKHAAGATDAIKAAGALSKAGEGTTFGNVVKNVAKDMADTIRGRNDHSTTSGGTRAADRMNQQTSNINSAKEAAAAKESASYVNGVDASAFVG